MSLTYVRQVGGVGAMDPGRTLVQLDVPMNQRRGDMQQTEGPTAEQHGAEHPAAVRQTRRRRI